MANRLQRRADKRAATRALARGVAKPTGEPTAILKPRKGLHMRIGTDGTIEVRHAADVEGTTLRGDSIELTCADWPTIEAADRAPAVWIQLAKVGQFAGHPAGPFRLDSKTFAEIEHNFRATENRRIPIDFEHASEQAASNGDIPRIGAPAQGWILDLDNRGSGGLWGLVEWGDEAREYIRDGKYRYFSPAIRFNSKDRVTGAQIGARMTSGGLTNQPFLDGMQPLAAKDADAVAAGDGMGQRLMPHGQFMGSLRAALKLPELATYAECGDQLARLRTACGMAEHPEAMHEGVNLAEYMSPIKAMMNMPAHASYEDLFDAVEEMVEAALARHEAEFHGDAAGEESPPSSRDMKAEAATAADKETAMADEKQIKDLEDKAAALAAQVATLGVQLSEATLNGKAVAAELATVTTERDALLSDKAARDAKDVETEVEEAITYHGKAKGISMADKGDLVTMRTAAPAAFAKLYPRLPVDQRHLTARITTRGGEPPATREKTTEKTTESTVLAMADKAAAFVAKGMTREDAVIAAMRDSN